MARKILVVLLFLSISTRSFAQELSGNNQLVSDAFNLAVETLKANIHSGALIGNGDYNTEWTRDMAINSWNGLSLLSPDVAERSLWSVTAKKDSVLQQYWDRMLWAIAAYNHYMVTGDRKFLKQAYTCAANTIGILEKKSLDGKYGLFMGPSVFNDGISAYPEPIYEPDNTSFSVLKHENSVYIKCLSTNCVYYGAYLALAKMARMLNEDKLIIGHFEQRSRDTKSSILKYFYNDRHNKFYYLIDQNGDTYDAQEGLGISFAVIFGIIEGEKAEEMIGNAHVSEFGITSIYPDFSRNSEDKPGRYNNIIWPMVNGFFAQAAIYSREYTVFTNELNHLTHLALDADKGDHNFREVYNPYTGKPDGGWQGNGQQFPDFHWKSGRDQTWSATAYISMVLNGIFGLKFSEHALLLHPFLPPGIDHIELKKLRYRNALLHITINGRGKSIKNFTVDGKQRTNHAIDSTTSGEHTISIELE